jgi:hypothetical protein
MYMFAVVRLLLFLDPTHLDPLAVSSHCASVPYFLSPAVFLLKGLRKIILAGLLPTARLCPAAMGQWTIQDVQVWNCVRAI